MGHRLHIGLGIAAAHAHRVQLQQLARIVFVDMAFGIAGVVQVQQHGRVAHAGLQQAAEVAQGMRANRPLLIIANPEPGFGLARADIEVVHPEPGHLLLQLGRRVQRTQHLALLGLGSELVQVALHLLAQARSFALSLALLGGRACCLALGGNAALQILHAALADFQGRDVLLGRLRQAWRLARCKLLVQPALQAQPLQLPVSAVAGATADTVQPLLALGGAQRRIGQRRRCAGRIRGRVGSASAEPQGACQGGGAEGEQSVGAHGIWKPDAEGPMVRLHRRAAVKLCVQNVKSEAFGALRFSGVDGQRGGRAYLALTAHSAHWPYSAIEWSCTIQPLLLAMDCWRFSISGS